MKKFLWSVLILVVLFPFHFLVAQTPINNAQDKNYINSKYRFSMVVPKNWASEEKEYKTLKGGFIQQVYVAQQNDFTSRRTKYFIMRVGSPESFFGLSSNVVQKITHEQMVDFYINQSYDALIGYTVTKTSTATTTGNEKVYVVEGSYTEPGPYKVIFKDFFQFSSDKIYYWSFNYFSTYSGYLSDLQKIANSVTIIK